MTKAKFEQIAADDVFKDIKDNYKRYLDDSMVTHLLVSIDGSNHKETIVQEYLEKLGNFHDDKKTYMEDLIKEPTAADKIGRGALCALVGAGVAGGAFLSAKKSTDIADGLNPLGQAKEGVEGVFAGVIGTCFAVAMNKVWNKLDTTAPQIDEKTMEHDIKESELHDKHYQKLSAELVKLFYFREGLITNHDEFRKGFIDLYPDLFDSEKTPCPDGVTHEQILSVAIEVYFLKQLNQVFKDGFEAIYQIHDKEIESDKTPIFGWIKIHMDSLEKRQRFTQQMQVEFMRTCIKFLQTQMNEHSFMRKHVFIMDTVFGLVAGLIALSVSIVVFPMSIFGIIGIGLVFACIAAVTSHLTISKIDSLKFKRTKANRAGLLTAIEEVESERDRLAGLIKEVVMTSDHDLKELKDFQSKSKSGFWSVLHLLPSKAMWLGGVRAWLREYARRYNHSIQTDIRLCDADKQIIDIAQKQTQVAQEELIKFMALEHDKKVAGSSFFKDLVANTREYLKAEPIDPSNDDSHKGFIESFRIRQKIREQVLEILAVLPEHTHHTELPAELVSLYTDPVDKHGLGGLRSDLERVRSIAPIVSATTALDSHHPYHRLADAAHRINTLMNDPSITHHESILPGQNVYRGLLGMPEKHFFSVEEQWKDASTIQLWLNASFDFLCSLNRYDLDLNDPWDKPFQDTDDYNVYRMLLVKQLASLWDPKNQLVSNTHKQDIARFAREKLKCEPDIAFTDVLNHSLLIHHFKEDDPIPMLPRKIEEISLIGLEDAAAAIRLDMAYDVSVPPSAKMLIDFAASEFTKTGRSQIIFSVNHALKHLKPNSTDDYYKSVDQAIISTRNFVAYIQQSSQHHLLCKTGTIHRYLLQVFGELTELTRRINEEIKESFPDVQHPDDPLAPCAALFSKNQVLDDFHTELKGIFDALPVLTDAAVIKAESGAQVSGRMAAADEEVHHDAHEALHSHVDPIIEKAHESAEDLLHHLLPHHGHHDSGADEPHAAVVDPVVAHSIEVPVVITPAPVHIDVQLPPEPQQKVDGHAHHGSNLLEEVHEEVEHLLHPHHEHHESGVEPHVADLPVVPHVLLPNVIPGQSQPATAGTASAANDVHDTSALSQPKSSLSVAPAVALPIDEQFDKFLEIVGHYIARQQTPSKKSGWFHHASISDKIAAASSLREVLVNLRHQKPLEIMPKWVDEKIYKESDGLKKMIKDGLATIPGHPKGLKDFFQTVIDRHVALQDDDATHLIASHV